MDSDGDGTMETRTITLQERVTFQSGSIGVSAVFNWRGQVPNQLVLSSRMNAALPSSINVSGSGDVTLDNEIFSG